MNARNWQLDPVYIASNAAGTELAVTGWKEGHLWLYGTGVFPSPSPTMSLRPTLRPPWWGPELPAAVVGSVTLSGITPGEAEAHAAVFVDAFAAFYGCDPSQVVVAFDAAMRRRRLQAGDVLARAVTDDAGPPMISSG